MIEDISLLRKLQKIYCDWFYRLTDWEKDFISEMYGSVFEIETGQCSMDIDTPDEELEEFSGGAFGQKQKISEIYSLYS